jgi:hypothetical protein
MTVTNRLLLKTELGFPAPKSVGRSFLILALLFIGFLTSCQTDGDELTYIEKIEAFEERFSVGMSKQEVEGILDGLEGVSFLNDEHDYLSCDLWVNYKTSPELYGSFIFSFCYALLSGK